MQMLTFSKSINTVVSGVLLITVFCCSLVNSLSPALYSTMANHFEMPQFRALADVIRSDVWVGNERLINTLINLIVQFGRDVIQQTFTPHFCASVFQVEEQLQEPTINVTTLQTLVDSGLWREHQRVVEFIMEHYENLSEEEQQQFGSMEFLEFVLDDGKQYGEGAERFYQVGEEGRLHVQQFNAGTYI